MMDYRLLSIFINADISLDQHFQELNIVDHDGVIDSTLSHILHNLNNMFWLHHISGLFVILHQLSHKLDYFKSQEGQF